MADVLLYVLPTRLAVAENPNGPRRRICVSDAVASQVLRQVGTMSQLPPPDKELPHMSLTRAERKAARWPTAEIADVALVLGLAVWREGIPRKRYALYSGGGDSGTSTAILMDIFDFDAVFHIETGTGIRSTTDHVIEECRRKGWPLVHKRPRLDTLTGKRGMEYRAMVAGLTQEEVDAIRIRFELQHGRPMTDKEVSHYGLRVQHARGFPGPGAHRFAYIRLKDRAVADLVRESKEAWKDRIWLATGVRSQESVRRMGTVNPIQREGARVWVAPIWTYSKGDCHRTLEEQDVRQSPASMFIGMSGECLCGAYAKKGELDAIATQFPDDACPLIELERLAVDRGCPSKRVWGRRSSAPGVMCVGCESNPKVTA